jgi:AraC-like DNA-binding protein
MIIHDLIDPVQKYLDLIQYDNGMSLPNLTILKVDEITRIEAVVYNPVICLILQGAKETAIGDQVVTLRAGDALVVSHDLPVLSRITSATPDKPYIALILSLDLGIVRGLYEQVGAALNQIPTARSLSTGSADTTLIDPISRYIALAGQSLDAQVLGSPLLREIHYRLLMSPIGGMLRHLLSVDSHASRVAKAILKIRSNFQQPLSIAELARSAGMSQSSFHGHFKQVTGTSPLQYQKDLRMITARDLLRAGRHNVSSASFEVGYESSTHFSRDYQRKFGVSPSRDISLKRVTA